MKKRLKVSLVGCGALGSIIANSISQDLNSEYELLGVMSHRPNSALKLSQYLNCKAYNDMNQLIIDKPDYIIEAASPNVIREIGLEILNNNINLIPLSIGAFADSDFYESMKKAAIENNCRIHFPSGAVGGFDVLRNAMLMEEASVSIFTEKSPESLNGAPFLKGRQLSIEEEEVVFIGSAKAAIEAFPRNVNVAVATALATVGVDNLETVIKSIPGMKSNKHEIKFRGKRTNISLTVETIPSEENPKSSELAAYSVISLLKNLVSPITF